MAMNRRSFLGAFAALAAVPRALTGLIEKAAPRAVSFPDSQASFESEPELWLLPADDESGMVSFDFEVDDDCDSIRYAVDYNRAPSAAEIEAVGTLFDGLRGLGGRVCTDLPLPAPGESVYIAAVAYDRRGRRGRTAIAQVS